VTGSGPEPLARFTYQAHARRLEPTRMCDHPNLPRDKLHSLRKTEIEALISYIRLISDPPYHASGMVYAEK